jgi:hypothetical protein
VNVCAKGRASSVRQQVIIDFASSIIYLPCRTTGLYRNLSVIRFGTFCAPIWLSKNCAKKSSMNHPCVKAWEIIGDNWAGKPRVITG